MNTAEIITLLKTPEHITPEQTQALNTVIAEFPYFQSARALHLKGLKDNTDFKYNQALKTTAAYTTDRSVLFDFITSKYFLQNNISKSIKNNPEHIRNIDVTVEDISITKQLKSQAAINKQIEDTAGILEPELFIPKVNTKDIAYFSDDDGEATKPEDILNIGKPLEFNTFEQHSFNEWLKLTQTKPIIRSESTSKSETLEKQERQKKFDLIDKFIKTKPKIEPSKALENSGNIAQDRMIQPEVLMTETLARIYVEQKKYDKAIQSYEILSLKYPKKSGFFADQIRAVKALQKQNNS